VYINEPAFEAENRKATAKQRNNENFDIAAVGVASPAAARDKLL